MGFFQRQLDKFDYISYNIKMEKIEFRLKSEFDGVVKYLEGQIKWTDRWNDSYIVKLARNASLVCRSCPLAQTCRPKLGYRTFLDRLKTAVIVSGGEINSEKCQLQQSGVVFIDDPRRSLYRSPSRKK